MNEQSNKPLSVTCPANDTALGPVNTALTQPVNTGPSAEQLREALSEVFEHLENISSVTMQDARNDGAEVWLEKCVIEADKGVQVIKRLALAKSPALSANGEGGHARNS